MRFSTEKKANKCYVSIFSNPFVVTEHGKVTAVGHAPGGLSLCTSERMSVVQTPDSRAIQKFSSFQKKKKHKRHGKVIMGHVIRTIVYY